MKLFNILCLIALLHGTLLAQSTWVYIGDDWGAWSDPNNWDIGTAPTTIEEDDMVTIPVGKIVFVSEFLNHGTIINDGMMGFDGEAASYGTIVNNGNLTIYDGTIIHLEDDALFENYGELIIYGYFNHANGEFINHADGMIVIDVLVASYGRFGIRSTFVNEGTIENHQFLTNNFNVSFDNNGVIENHHEFQNLNLATINNYGEIHNVAGEIIVQETSVINNLDGEIILENGSSFNNDGEILISEETVINNNGEINNDGTITNNGTLNGTGIFNQSGTLVFSSTTSLEPGNSIGTLNIMGDVDFGEATYNAEIDGMTMTADLIGVSGDITLTNSTLNITWLDPPTSEGTYNIILHDGRVGEFSSINIGSIPDHTATINYATNAVQLIVESSPTVWTYTGPDGGDWHSGSNWDIGTAPYPIESDEIVLIPTGKCVSNGFIITNEGTITINGMIVNEGDIESSGIITNNGTIYNKGSFGVFINSGTFENTGIIMNTGTVESEGSISNDGTIDNIGMDCFLLNSGTLSNNGTINHAAGWLANEGTISNNEIGSFENNDFVTNNGTIVNAGIMKGSGLFEQNNILTHSSTVSLEPGNSIGTLAILGDMDFGEATYEAELDGMTMTADLIDVSGDIILTNSTLNVTWLDPPTALGTYNIIQFSNRTGEFAQVNIPSIPGYSSVINYATNAVQIIVTVVLPVEFISFSGQQVNSDIQLDWITSSEINNEGFDIERRTGNGSWELVGFVAGQHNTNQETKYNYIDTPDQAGQYLYRLRQIDFDGRESHSDVIAVKYVKDERFEGLSEIKRSGSAHFYFDSPTDETIEFVLYDAGGRVIHQEKVSAQQLIDLSRLSTGMYFYSAQQGTEVLPGKMFLD